jgi:hypothetical protein
MKKLIISVFIAMTYQVAFAQTSPDLEELKKINAKFIHNYVTNDVESHSKIIHPDFIHISSTGKIVSREEYLKNWAHGYDGMVYWDYRNEFIKIYGNMALVHSVNQYTHVQNGKETKGMSIYTDTYIKENGKWLCVQAQISTVTPENQKNYSTIVRQYDASGK